MESRFKFWHLTLILSMISFSLVFVLYFILKDQLHMDNLLDFFVIIAEISIYGQYMGILIFSGIALGILTIILAIFRK